MHAEPRAKTRRKLAAAGAVHRQARAGHGRALKQVTVLAGVAKLTLVQRRQRFAAKGRAAKTGSFQSLLGERTQILHNTSPARGGLGVDVRPALRIFIVPLWMRHR